VENLCGDAQSDPVVPLLTEAAVTVSPLIYKPTHAAAAAWCAEVDAAVKSGICTVSDEGVALETNLGENWCS
jgi:hypothetical protein